MKKLPVITVALMILVTSCGRNSGETSAAASDVGTGSLEFYANGEDFVRSGFTSADGWFITFRHLYITVADVTAYQTNPPYDPDGLGDISGEAVAVLEGTYTLDLAEGDQPVLAGIVADVPAGHYNAISWSLIPASSGPAEGYSIYIDAQAEKDDQSYNVLIGIEQGYSYRAGEYVGESRKGIVAADGTADIEMTFHFDHLFGDMEQPADCALNTIATGFEPFARLMQEGTVQEDLHSLSLKLPEETYEKLLAVLLTLGHTGEGHCSCEAIL